MKFLHLFFVDVKSMLDINHLLALLCSHLTGYPH